MSTGVYQLWLCENISYKFQLRTKIKNSDRKEIKWKKDIIVKLTFLYDKFFFLGGGVKLSNNIN